MVTPATTDGLPTVMNSSEVARALKQSLHRTQFQLRTGTLPGIKLPGGRWRVRCDVVQAILAGQADVSPAERRRAALGDDVVQWLQELAANAGPLTNEQRDIIKSAFRGSA